MKIFWFTGLSGAGKTTLAKKIRDKLKKKKYKIKIIDGDIFRKKTKNKNNFTKTNVIKNNLKIINYIKRIQKKYHFILFSVKKFGSNYYEILVKCNINELIKRDTKGLYKLANEKKINNLIGYKSKIKYEKSNYKVVTINTSKLSKAESIKKILKSLKNEKKN